MEESIKAQDKMKQQADSHRRAFEFNTGYWVYLRLQHFVNNAFRATQNLSHRYLRPFQITQKVNPIHINYS